DRPLDAELGKHDQQAGRHARQRQQRAGPLAPQLLGAERHRRRGLRGGAQMRQREARPPPARPRRCGSGKGERHQRKVTRVSRPRTCGMLEGSSSSISTWTTRASVEEPPSGSMRCMRFTVGAIREILPREAVELPPYPTPPSPPRNNLPARTPTTPRWTRTL